MDLLLLHHTCHHVQNTQCQDLHTWFTVILCSTQITPQDVCFWDYPHPYFYTKEMCEAKLYPPRFSVCVRGRLSDEVRSEFKFTGVEAYPGRRQPSSTVYFPLPGQRHSQSLSTGSCMSLTPPVFLTSLILLARTINMHNYYYKSKDNHCISLRSLQDLH